MNKEEVDRLNYEFNGIYNGDDFIDEKHPYTSDLDIFGRNSIFQLINRACTRKGISLIKSWFENASSRDVIETRQQAVTELRPLVDWRQKIQAFGRENSNKKLDEQPFYDWLEGDDLIKNNLFYRIIPYITIVFSISIIVGVIFGKLSFYFLLSPFIITGYFLFKIIDYSKATYEMTQTGVSILESVENIILQIENVDFEHNYLSTLRSSLMPQNIVASAKIKDLKTIFDWLSQRSNMMYLIFNSIFLLDFILLARAEKWRAKYKDEISRWFDAIAEFEALSSIAAFAFANEDYVFPEIAENAFFVHGTNLGHPLIPDDQRINNDFKLEGRGNSCIITGSNMAGKSTFLRTVGINAILAFTGAPVCADSFQISNVRVFTSMRTKDNLEENISSFYAELLRLKMLLEQINEDKPVLFLLDEILKGTNSADRHIGAESLILQLNEMNAFGLVSTHDLELGKLQRKNNQL
ncbi:MAG: DNA mismatch repair protein MutS, partial [Cyclobacteriaceae bacterium]|nr:DNA mismatch repair protein MutS [Cyclobacteriaceae bacterium]